MNDNLGTIKIMEGRIITKKDEKTEVWSQGGGGDPNNYIVYNGLTYRLLNGKDPEKTYLAKKKYEEIEDDIDNLEDF
jgi:hypothetical protein